MADIELEKFLFMKASETLNRVGEDDLRRLLEVANIILENMSLSAGNSDSELSIIHRQVS